MISDDLGYQHKNLSGRGVFIGLMILISGLVLLALGYSVNSDRAAYNTLIILLGLLSVGFGSIFFVTIEHLFSNRWSVPFRRVAENLSSVLLVAPLFAIPLAFNMQELFPWMRPDVVEADYYIKGKTPYLNETFFWARNIGIFAILYIFFLLIVRRSWNQDKTKNPDTSKRLKRASGAFLPVFAISITVLAVDWSMSLAPKWFSTMWGVYYFAGSILAGLALITFVSITLKENGYMSKYINPDHYYNFGALIYGLTSFWAYIAFGQFLLIWYANVPDEIFWYMDRAEGAWLYFTLALPIIRFIVPFLVMITKPAKSDPVRLKFIALWIFAGHLYDLFHVIMPEYSKFTNTEGTIPIGWIELSIPLVVVGVTTLMFNLVSRNRAMIAIGDPQIKKGLFFHL